MIYYECNRDGFEENARIISPSEFKKLFGRSYGDFSKEEYDYNAVRARKIKFANAHCCLDPFAKEIHGYTEPLVYDNFSQLSEEYDRRCDDI